MSINTYAPLKILRGNQSRFMNKELSKAIMKRSALKSKYHKHPNSTNRALFKKQRNICVSLRRKAIKNYFNKSFKNVNVIANLFMTLLNPI